MGFEVHVVVALPKPPNEALMTALDHKFGVASHEVGTRIVNLTEHVTISSEADAVEFVRGLVLDAVPPGSKISEVTSVPG
ncbi:MAG: hypothetical protein FD127_937 [Acidimicrobiaceae bacterium]|jgi:hypothetical protein|nr:MAG: hypothetical protein FD127_937 [Acidimicrobiaceae bacterium]